MKGMEMRREAAHGEMSVEEMRETNTLQSVLSVVDFAKKNGLNVDPMRVVMEHAPEFSTLRHDAGMQFALPGENGVASMSKRFKAYYVEHRDEVHALNMEDGEQLAQLLENVRAFPVEPGGGAEPSLH
jgi:hypothetical protein